MGGIYDENAHVFFGADGTLTDDIVWMIDHVGGPDSATGFGLDFPTRDENVWMILSATILGLHDDGVMYGLLFSFGVGE
jgi:hypothetical protein